MASSVESDFSEVSELADVDQSLDVMGKSEARVVSSQTSSNWRRSIIASALCPRTSRKRSVSSALTPGLSTNEPR